MHISTNPMTPAIPVDQHGWLAHVSNTWLETLGYHHDEVIGSPWVYFLTPASRVYADDIVIPHLFRHDR